MKCEEIREILSIYIDNKLTNEESNEIEKHLETCDECRREYEDLLTIKKLLAETPQVQLPENFKAELHKKLIQCVSDESNQVLDFEKKLNRSSVSKKKFNWKVLSSIAAVIFLMVISVELLINNNFRMGKLSGAEKQELAKEDNVSIKMAKDKAKYSIESENKAPAENGEFQTDSYDYRQMNKEAPKLTKNNHSTENLENPDSKIIKTGYIHIEIESYDLAYQDIVDIVNSNEGYLQSSNMINKKTEDYDIESSSKTGSIVIRIPQSKFNNIFSEVAGMGIIINQNTSFNDVTGEYENASNELAKLDIQGKEIEDEFKDDKSEEEQDELIEAKEKANNLNSSIEQWNDLVEFSTINIILEEVDNKEIKR